MKQYFAKLISVEGEIKKGDRYFAYNTLQDETAHIDNPGMDVIPTSKAKLFLCSRDVQVGGEFFNSEDSSVKRFNYNPTTVDILGGYNYRIIGEISPEATWVKEGDEFDEAEVEEYWFSVRDKTSIVDTKLTNQNNTFKKYPNLFFIAYRIIGPCGHFH